MKKKQWMKTLGRMLLLITLALSVQKTDAKADEKTAENLASKTGYTVEAILPETQIDKGYSFFYIHAEPEQEQILKVKITSKRKEASTVKIGVTNASTSTSGQIVYGDTQQILDRSLNEPVTDFVRPIEKKVTVKNFEEKVVEIRVTPPKASFSGVRLGALTFKGQEDVEKKGGGVGNTYGYKIGVMVNEDLRPYNEGGRVVYQAVKATLYNGEKVIATTVQNPEPKVLENITMKTQIRRKGEKEVLYSNGLGSMKWAPNSSFDFLTYTGIEDIQPGKYVLSATATDGKETWNWEKEFEVTDKQANKINKDAAYKVTMPKLFKVLGSILIVLTLGNIGYLIYRRRMNEEKKQGGGKDDAKKG